MERVGITIGDCKRLDIWSEVCIREGWTKKTLEEMVGIDKVIIAIDKDLLKGKHKNFITGEWKI